MAPRWTGIAVYGLLAWSFLVEIIGSAINANRWFLDTSLLHHVAPTPAVDPDWTSFGSLLGLAIVAALIGSAVFDRRDLATA